MPDTNLRAEEIIAALVAAQVDFVVIGGFAGMLHGSSHITFDFDAAIGKDRPTAKALTVALEPFHPRPRGIGADLPFVWDEAFVHNMSVLTLDTDLGDIDFLTEPDGSPPYAVLKEHAVKKKIFGYEVDVCSLEDLISMKKAAGRVKDQLHLLELEAIKKILAEHDDSQG